MSKTFQSLNQEDLRRIVQGSSLLGSGGGGSYAMGMQFVENFQEGTYYKSSVIEVVPVNALCNNPLYEHITHGIVVAYIGSPESINDLKYPDDAVYAAQVSLKKQKIKVENCCIVPVELGPISSIVACLVAAKLGVPVLDGDGAGRAVPTLELCTFSCKGVSVNPTVLAISNKKNKHYIELAVSEPTLPGAAARIESLARPIISMPEFGQKAGLAMWTMHACEIGNVVLPNTLTLCKELGSVVAQAKHSFNTSLVVDYLNKRESQDYKAQVLYHGKLQSAQTTTTGGFDFGTITLADTLHKDDRTVKIIFQNESLLLWDSTLSSPSVMAPDLISYLITHTTGDVPKHQWVFTNGDIMKDGALIDGFENSTITVLALQAPSKLRESESAIAKHLQDHVKPHTSKTSTLPQNYSEQLTHFGYYGKNVKFKANKNH